MPSPEITIKQDPNTIVTPEVPENVKGLTFSVDDGLLSGNSDLTTIKVDNKEVKTEPAEIKKEVVEEVKKEESKVLEEAVKKEEKVTTVEEKKEEKKEEKSISSVLTPPKEEKKEVEQKVEETKSGDKGGIKPIGAELGKQTDTFDYSKYAPQHVTNMKNMSRQSREAYAKLVEENEKLSKTKDSLYLQHEGAYVLSPEFQQGQQKLRMARTEGEVWKKALLDIRAGKEYREITGFDANGRPVLSEPLKPSDEDEIRIQNNVLACQQAEGQVASQLQSLPQQYQQRINNDLSAIEAEQQRRFAWVADPKLMEYSLNVDGLGEKKVKEVINDFKSILPSYMANHPLSSVAANLFVALQIQGAELRAALANKTVADIKASEQKKVEPTSDKRDSGSERKGDKKGIPSTFSLEGMPGM